MSILIIMITISETRTLNDRLLKHVQLLLYLRVVLHVRVDRRKPEYDISRFNRLRFSSKAIKRLKLFRLRDDFLIGGRSLL